MDFITIKALSFVLLPPLNLLLLAGLGSLLLMFRRKGGWALLVMSLAGLFVLSMPVVATALAALLEHRPASGSDNLADAQAIVILGAGSYPAAPEYGADTVSAPTLERLRWGARLHRATGLPVLVSGGNPNAIRTSEADQMKIALNQDFRTDVKWLEDKSFNTFESARYVRQQLAGAKVDRIALVTHALYMRRARLVFEQAGFRVIEAPTGFSTLQSPGILDFLPSSHGLGVSRAFFHEVLGLGWYHVRLAAGGTKGQP
jgi:uncharacterized SAM-binding protein YcdF (DUF218 family)